MSVSVPECLCLFVPVSCSFPRTRSPMLLLLPMNVSPLSCVCMCLGVTCVCQNLYVDTPMSEDTRVDVCIRVCVCVRAHVCWSPEACVWTREFHVRACTGMHEPRACVCIWMCVTGARLWDSSRESLTPRLRSSVGPLGQGLGLLPVSLQHGQEGAALQVD